MMGTPKARPPYPLPEPRPAPVPPINLWNIRTVAAWGMWYALRQFRR